MLVNFTPIPVVEPGKKRRANAKDPVLTKITHFHEDFTLQDLLSKILVTLKREDLIAHSWLYHGHALEESDLISVSYTIPRHVLEQIIINDTADFKQMVEEATFKLAAEAKLFIIEKKVCLASLLLHIITDNDPSVSQTHGEDDPDEESEHEETTGCKKQKVGYYLHVYLRFS
jgi:hypothetical protein